MRLKQVIESTLSVPVKIKLGAPGALDVVADGKTVFSHKQAGSLPDDRRLLERLRALQPPI